MKTKARPRSRQREPEEELLEQQVRICKAFANTTRLRLLELLGTREYSVAELQKTLAVSKANLSQHLGIVKSAGIVRTRREGRRIYCSLAIREVSEACHLIREVLRAQLQSRKTLSL